MFNCLPPISGVYEIFSPKPHLTPSAATLLLLPYSHNRSAPTKVHNCRGASRFAYKEKKPRRMHIPPIFTAISTLSSELMRALQKSAFSFIIILRTHQNSCAHALFPRAKKRAAVGSDTRSEQRERPRFGNRTPKRRGNSVRRRLERLQIYAADQKPHTDTQTKHIIQTLAGAAPKCIICRAWNLITGIYFVYVLIIYIINFNPLS